MSKLRLWSKQGSWQLNVLSFSSPIVANITSAQTKKRQDHYPVKIGQANLSLSVIFSSEVDFEQFQRFVRAHQQDAGATGRLVSLNWPERDINNWTGVIKNFRAGGQRFNYAPRAQFDVELVDSSVAKRTEIASLGANVWRAIYGLGMPGGVLEPPSDYENDILLNQFGQDQTGTTGRQIGTSATNTPLPNASQPGFGPSGITSGSTGVPG